MKQVHLTINVSDSKVNQLIELLSKNFGTVKVTEVQEDIVVPEWHKKIVRDRIKNTKPEDYISLEELESRLKFAGK